MNVLDVMSLYAMTAPGRVIKARIYTLNAVLLKVENKAK